MICCGELTVTVKMDHWGYRMVRCGICYRTYLVGQQSLVRAWNREIGWLVDCAFNDNFL